jgi:FixJ family two-component response regulator
MVFTRIKHFSRALRGGSMRSGVGTPLVGIIDDDESVRDSISSLIRSAGYGIAVFASSDAFLHSEHVRDGKGMILLLDIQMPGLNGLELQRRLSDLKCSIPVIFVTAHRDEGVRLRALKQGAFAFFAKPFTDQAILDAIRSALESSRHKY